MTEFTVTPESDTTVPTPDAVAAPAEPRAILSLKARRAELAEKLWIDLRVPRWTEPAVFVRYAPINTVQVDKAVAKRQNKKTDDWSLLANADILINACLGVYATLDGNSDEKYSLVPGNEHAPWTKFDQDLGRALGLDQHASQATDVVKELYLTDGDLIAAANQVFEFSGVSNEKVDADFSTP